MNTFYHYPSKTLGSNAARLSQLKHPSDNPSIGLILCKSKNEVLAEYTLRDVKTYS